MKAFICLLGILLLLILLFGKLVLFLVHKGDDEEVPVPTPEPHIPVIHLLTNVWIMEADEEGLLIFRDGRNEHYPWGVQSADSRTGDVSGEGNAGSQASGAFPGENVTAGDLELTVREQVADIELTDGCVTAVTVKRNKINGKILSADEKGIEVEGYGKLPLASDYKGYRLYDSLEMCTADDLLFGYDFTDLCKIGRAHV